MNKQRSPTNVKSQMFQNYFDTQKHENNDQSPNPMPNEYCFKGCYFLELEGGKLFTYSEKRDNQPLKDMSKEFFLLELEGGKELEK